MELTGKCKIKFRNYLEKQTIENKLVSYGYDIFYQLPQSMQYGVYVDFFDSVSLNIYVKPLSNKKWSVYIDDYGVHIVDYYLVKDTRQEAREEAIEKANEIYNEK